MHIESLNGAGKSLCREGAQPSTLIVRYDRWVQRDAGPSPTDRTPSKHSLFQGGLRFT